MGQTDKKMSHLLMQWDMNAWERDTEEEPQSILAIVVGKRGDSRQVRTAEKVVREVSLRLGDAGVLQAHPYEERRQLARVESWRVRFMGGGVTWPSTLKNLNSNMDDYVGTY